MRLCINPQCNSSDHTNLDTAKTCKYCGSKLLVDCTYAVKRLLSDKSGFGTIYEVEDETQHVKVLKILKPEFNDEQRTVTLFQQEAYLLGKIDSPGLPKIDAYIHHDLRDHSILHGIVMEKIEGGNLNEWLKAHQDKPISQKVAIAWLKQIVRILQLVHQEGYFHRDIKPSNIMLKPSGQLVLIDFGTAREETYTYLAKIGSLGGITQFTSAGYTAPEQESGFAVPQSDFYSLGMTLLHLVTGKYPLKMYDSHAGKHNWREHAPQISSALADFLDCLIDPKPTARPRDCATILHTLDELEREVKEQSPSKTQIKIKEQPKWDSKVWIGIAIALIAVGLTGYAIGSYYRLVPSSVPTPSPTLPQAPR